VTQGLCKLSSSSSLLPSSFAQPPHLTDKDSEAHGEWTAQRNRARTHNVVIPSINIHQRSVTGQKLGDSGKKQNKPRPHVCGARSLVEGMGLNGEHGNPLRVIQNLTRPGDSVFYLFNRYVCAFLGRRDFIVLSFKALAWKVPGTSCN
jgi:hypothetical protein